MAEHQLKLKAVLDTQEVQNELQKLRSQQQQALGGQGGAANAGTQNLTALTSTIGKLNTSIGQLQKAISGMSRGIYKPVPGPSQSQYIPPIALPSGTAGGPAAFGSHVQKAIDVQVRQAVLKSLKSGDGQYIAQQVTPGLIGGVFGGTKGSPAQQASFKKQFAGMAASDFWDASKNRLTPVGEEVFGSMNAKKQNQAFIRGARMLAGNFLLGGLASDLKQSSFTESPGTRWTGEAMGAASQGLMGASMMSMMGMGPYGAAIVGVGMAVSEIAKAFGEMKAEKMTNLAAALQRANDAWESMYENFQKWDFSKFKERIGSLDFGNLEGERAAARSQYDTDKKDYDEFMSGWVDRMRSLDKQYFSGQITAGQYANAKQDANTELESYKEAMEKAKDRLDAVNAVYEDHKKALEDFNNVVKQAAQFDKRLSEFNAEQITKDVIKSEDPEKIKTLMPGIQADIDKATADMAPIRNAGGLAAYEKETNTYREKLLTAEPGSAEADSLRAIIKAREEAAEAYKQSAADLMKAVAKSKSLEDTIEQLQKQLQEVAKNAATQKDEIARDQEAAKNTYQQKWGRVSTEVLDKSSKDYWTKAASYRKAYDDALTKAQNAKTPEEAKAAMDEAADAKSKWTFNQQQAISFDQSIVNRLQEKLSDLKAPSMTQVNSLASQGLMINKNDDEIRWKQQTDYASQQTQLQREIRDRLQQMDSSATFQ